MHSEAKSHLICHLRLQIPAVPSGEHLPSRGTQRCRCHEYQLPEGQTQRSRWAESIPPSAFTKTLEFPAEGPWSTWPPSHCDLGALCCTLPTLTSLHRRPDVDKGGGTQCHIIIISTDLGQESRPPWEHGVLGEPCPSWHHRSSVAITQQGTVSITDRWVLGSWSLINTAPLHPCCTAQGRWGQPVWTLKRVEIISGSLINVGFRSVPEALLFWQAPGSAGCYRPSDHMWDQLTRKDSAIANTNWGLQITTEFFALLGKNFSGSIHTGLLKPLK